MNKLLIGAIEAALVDQSDATDDQRVSVYQALSEVINKFGGDLDDDQLYVGGMSICAFFVILEEITDNPQAKRELSQLASVGAHALSIMWDKHQTAKEVERIVGGYEE